MIITLLLKTVVGLLMVFVMVTKVFFFHYRLTKNVIKKYNKSTKQQQ